MRATRDTRHIAIGSGSHGNVGAVIDGDREHLAAVVIHMLADEVHAGRRGREALRLIVECIDEKSARKVRIHAFT